MPGGFGLSQQTCRGLEEFVSDEGWVRTQQLSYVLIISRMGHHQAQKPGQTWSTKPGLTSSLLLIIRSCTWTEYFTLPHTFPQTPWGLHEDFVETPWILGGLHSAFPIVYMDSMESPCGVPVESTWPCGLHGDSSNSVSWTPHGLYEESPWTPWGLHI